MHGTVAGKPPLPNNTNAGEKQKAVASTSRHPFNTSELSRSGVPVTYHNLGPPSYECRSCNAQMWYEERTTKVRNWMSAVLDTETGQGVDETIVAGLITMLDKTSAVAQTFRMARDWCHSYESVNFELRLLSERTSVGQYKALKISEVATLITNDFGDSLPSRDIVVDSKDGGPKRIS
ncbi:hypothetical protein Tco_0694294 [Tanacetum coccineum]